jgi:hypothetical protein
MSNLAINSLNYVLRLANVKVTKLNSFQSRNDVRIFFMHLGKSAGTSIFEAMRLAMGAGWEGLIDTNDPIRNAVAIHNTNDLGILIPRFHEFRINLALNCMAKEYPLISGHIPYCKSAFDPYHDRYKFVTVLRDPVERVISSFMYGKGKGLNYAPDGKSVAPSEELEYFLSSVRGNFETNQYVAFFGGSHTTQSFENNLEQARKNVDDFDLIGFTDSMPHFIDRFNRLFNLELKVERLRTTEKVLNTKFSNEEKLAFHQLFTDDVKQRIADMSQGDYEIYNYARKLFHNK